MGQKPQKEINQPPPTSKKIRSIKYFVVSNCHTATKTLEKARVLPSAPLSFTCEMLILIKWVFSRFNWLFDRLDPQSRKWMCTWRWARGPNSIRLASTRKFLCTRRDVHRYNYRVLDFLTSMSPPVYYLLNPKGEESLRERGSVWLVPATRGWWKVRAAGAACLPASLPLSYESWVHEQPCQTGQSRIGKVTSTLPYRV